MRFGLAPLFRSISRMSNISSKFLDYTPENTVVYDIVYIGIQIMHHLFI